MLKSLRSWRQRKKPETSVNLNMMTLVFLERGAAGTLQGHCESCDAYQPIYVTQLIRTHGKTALLSEVQPHIPCFFCKQQGSVTVTSST